MAGSSLLALLDDIATVLDDIALMSKIAAKKTTGVLGDDLALDAQQVSGVRAEREIPVVWAVAKGSFRNKLILVPAALLVSAIALGTVKKSAFITQLSVVSGIAILMTIGVYGFVAGIVKVDDAGFYLIKDTAVNIWSSIKRWTGRGLSSNCLLCNLEKLAK